MRWFGLSAGVSLLHGLLPPIKLSGIGGTAAPLPPSFMRCASLSLSLLAFTVLLGRASVSSAEAVPPTAVELHWLGTTPPAAAAGVSWGVPWARGQVSREQSFILTTAAGEQLPLQTWPLAYWPDGSLKWSGFATVAGADAAATLRLAPAAAAAAEPTGPVVRVHRSDVTFEVDTGRLRVLIPQFGHTFVRSMSIDGREVVGPAQLVCLRQEGPEEASPGGAAREEFAGHTSRVSIEQDGPVRAVVKIEGVHRSPRTGRDWLPFVVRLYFYAGETTVRIVHTFIYDGDQHRDFIRGLGVRFAVPLREEPHNRHVRFGGEGDGLWSEPVQPLVGRGGRFATRPDSEEDLYPRQLTGQRVPNRAAISERGQRFMADWAVWNDFKLTQLSPDGFTLVKRTNSRSAWISAGKGGRAAGYVFAGDVSGGLGVSVRNFWQSYPASLEVRDAGSPQASIHAWLWSPDGPEMDLRYYDTIGHGSQSTYEGSDPARSDPLGVARTSELTLFVSDGVPEKATSAAMAQAGRDPALLVAPPAYLHGVRAFGPWSLPDRSTPFRRAIEERLESVLGYYLQAVEDHGWYGFWDYGDVMHSYDPPRHVWNYDLGGLAWDNSELATDMWLWLSFLRTGRKDVFRLAEAMTRHTGDVDCYHLGPYAGLGTRHNVRHWGLSAKEVRISQSAYRRYYYYLTTDEHTGDIMRTMLQAPAKMVEFDAMRSVQRKTDRERAIAPGRVRFGPDWLALVSIWMTEWERTNDPRWREFITNGMDAIVAMPLQIRTGRNLVMGFNPEDGRLFPLGDEIGTYNLATIMGGAEVVFELNDFIDHAGWDQAWTRYLRLYDAPRDVYVRDLQTQNEGADAQYIPTQQSGPRIAAYAYHKTGNPAFAAAAVRELVRRGTGPITTQRIAGPDALAPFEEDPRMNTNWAAQAGLDAILVLELCRDRLPVDVPPREGPLYDRF